MVVVNYCAADNMLDCVCWSICLVACHSVFLCNMVGLDQCAVLRAMCYHAASGVEAFLVWGMHLLLLVGSHCRLWCEMIAHHAVQSSMYSAYGLCTLYRCARSCLIALQFCCVAVVAREQYTLGTKTMGITNSSAVQNMEL